MGVAKSGATEGIAGVRVDIKCSSTFFWDIFALYRVLIWKYKLSVIAVGMKRVKSLTSLDLTVATAGDVRGVHWRGVPQGVRRVQFGGQDAPRLPEQRQVHPGPHQAAPGCMRLLQARRPRNLQRRHRPLQGTRRIKRPLELYTAGTWNQ